MKKSDDEFHVAVCCCLLLLLNGVESFYNFFKIDFCHFYSVKFLNLFSFPHCVSLVVSKSRDFPSNVSFVVVGLFLGQASHF